MTAIRFERITKINYQHVPAGNPAGGEFASVNGSAGHGRDINGIPPRGTGYSRDGNKVWRDSGGKAASRAIQTRMGELKVPPAWRDVRLHPDTNAALQAKGFDSKNREMPIYSAKHSAEAAHEKFGRLQLFNKARPAIEARIAKDLKSEHHDTREAAAVSYLVSRTGFRPGSTKDTKAEKQAYGATTLQAHHVTIAGSEVTFKFVGKKGVDITHVTNDPALAAFLQPRTKVGGNLFHTTYAKTRQYFKQMAGDFTMKDFRTWHGTVTAIKALQHEKPATSEKEFKKLQMRVATAASKHLGNSPAMALKAYIDPTVFTKYRPGGRVRKMDANDEKIMHDYLHGIVYSEDLPDPDTGEADRDDVDVDVADNSTDPEAEGEDLDEDEVAPAMTKGADLHKPICKIDDEQRLVTGWASVIDAPDGSPLRDLQGDVILEKDLVKAAHAFMLKSRTAGYNHTRKVGIGEVVESLVITKELKRQLGLPDSTPTGWLITVKVKDAGVWKMVKSGELQAFSIGGSATREPWSPK